MPINGKTTIVGLIGDPVSTSLSPLMHNSAFESAGLDWVYLPFSVSSNHLEAAVQGLPALGIRGVNVTIPHKQAVIPYLDELEQSAQAIGAVNTITVGEKLVGDNTDYTGFLADIATLNLNLSNTHCWVFGAGGATRALIYALQSVGVAQVVVFARNLQAVEALRDVWGGMGGYSTELTSKNVQKEIKYQSEPLALLINATPLGMGAYVGQSPIPDVVRMPATNYVYDLVYNPAQTKLIRQAQNAGIPTRNGLGMLLHQGAQAFKLWTGIEPDLAVMRTAIENRKKTQL